MLQVLQVPQVVVPREFLPTDCLFILGIAMALLQFAWLLSRKTKVSMIVYIAQKLFFFFHGSLSKVVHFEGHVRWAGQLIMSNMNLKVGWNSLYDGL